MQRLVEVCLLSRRQVTSVTWTHQRPEPCFEKLEVGCGIRQLEWVEAGGLAVGQRQVLASQSPHENLQASVLVEHDLRHALPVQHGYQEADEHCLAGAG